MAQITYTKQENNLYTIDFISHGFWEDVHDLSLNQLNYFKRLSKKCHWWAYNYIDKIRGWD